MNTSLKGLSLSALSLWLLVGCSGGGGGTSSAPPPPPPGAQPGALDAGGAGLTLDQIVNGSGAIVTASFSSATAINDNLQVIGLAEATPGTAFTAAMWSVDPVSATATPVALAPLPGGGFTSASALDAFGSPVGQAANDTNRLVAVTWKNGVGTPVVLPELAPAGNFGAFAVSSDGRLAVGEAVDGSGITRAVLWKANAAGNFVDPPAVLPFGAFSGAGGPSLFSSASALARVGLDEILVTGEAADGKDVLHAAVWRSVDGGATFTAVDLGVNNTVSAVNSHRMLVGEVSGGTASLSWAMDAQGAVGAPVSSPGTGTARAINESDRVVGSSGAASLATAWSGATTTFLYDTASEAYDLNDLAQPVVAGRIGNKGFLKRIP